MFEPPDPGHLNYGVPILWEEAVGSIVYGDNVEEVEDSSIEIGVLPVIGENHYIWVKALVDPVFTILHVIGGVVQLECLVSVEGV